MMTLTININKVDVYKEVDMTTAYIGAKDKEDGSSYVHISTVEENREKLNSFFAEAVKSFYGMCGRYLNGIDSKDANVLSVTLGMPENWNDSHKGMMDETVQSYLCCYVVSQWLMFVKRDEVQEYLTKAAALRDRIVKTLEERKRPERNKTHRTEMPVTLIEEHTETRNGLRVTVTETKDKDWWKKNVGGRVRVNGDAVEIGGRVKLAVGTEAEVAVDGYGENVPYVFAGFGTDGSGVKRMYPAEAGGCITIKIVRKE